MISVWVQRIWIFNFGYVNLDVQLLVFARFSSLPHVPFFLIESMSEKDLVLSWIPVWDKTLSGSLLCLYLPVFLQTSSKTSFTL